MNFVKSIAAFVLSIAAIQAYAEPMRLKITHAGTVTGSNENDIDIGADYAFSFSLDYDTEWIQPGLPEKVGGTAELSLLIDGTEYAHAWNFSSVDTYFNNYETETEVFFVVREGNYPSNAQSVSSSFWLPEVGLQSMLFSPVSLTLADPARLSSGMWVVEDWANISNVSLAPATMSLSISAVPEPGSVAMTLAGLLVVGFFLRRKATPLADRNSR